MKDKWSIDDTCNSAALKFILYEPPTSVLEDKDILESDQKYDVKTDTDWSGSENQYDIYLDGFIAKDEFIEKLISDKQ